MHSIQLNELVRKVIHLSSAGIPLLYWVYFDRYTMLRGILIVSTAFLVAEYLRLNYTWAETLFMRVFGPAIRDHEHSQLTGATYVFSGSALAIFLFPKSVAVVALLVLSISDTVAALVGIPFGKHRFLAKSMEGSLAFFTATMIILLLFYPGQYLSSIIIAALVTLAEANPLYLDDNFLIPVLTGTLLSLAALV